MIRPEKRFPKNVSYYLPKKRVKRRKLSWFSRARLPAVLALIFLGYLLFSFSIQFNRLSVMQKKLQEIQEEVQTLQQRNTSLQEELRMIQSDAYIEKEAREKLGLIKPGETRIVPVKPGMYGSRPLPSARTDYGTH